MGRRPSLTRADAAREALALIDAEGLEALTLAALARRLGVRAPSLYNHFAHRTDLVRLTARTVLAEAGELPPVARNIDWRALLTERAVLVRRAIVAHPNAAPLLLQVPPRLAAPGVYEYWIEVLEVGGVPPDRWSIILEGLEGMTYGSALIAAGTARVGAERAVVDASRFPAFAAAMRAERRTAEQVFLATIRTFLTAIGD